MSKVKSPTYRRLAENDRRQLLVEATIATLSEFGLSGTTVRKIAAKAGVTPGLVTHHFEGKEALVGAAYRCLAENFHRNYVAASLAAGEDPLQQLQAYVASAFQPDTLDTDLLCVWTSFWTSALSDKTSLAAKVHRETAEEARTYLRMLLREALALQGRQPAEAEIHDLAITVGSLLDGLWLTWGLDPALFSAEDARRMSFDVLATRLAIPELRMRQTT